MNLNSNSHPITIKSFSSLRLTCYFPVGVLACVTHGSTIVLASAVFEPEAVLKVWAFAFTYVRDNRQHEYSDKSQNWGGFRVGSTQTPAVAK